jgi:ABC-type phosphate transport system permease subunit
MLATTTIGRPIRHTSASCHDMTKSTMIVITRSSALLTNMISPTWTSSERDSTSAVMREITTPAFSLSKNDMERAWRWSNTRVRRSRRKFSPTRFTATMRVR